MPAATVDVRRGIACFLLAWLLLACQDAGAKQLLTTYSVIQILWIRFIAWVAITGWLLWAHHGRNFRTHRPGLQVVRTLLFVVELGLVMLAFRAMPLADAHAILAISPLIVTALAVPLLGERVGIRRWTAVGIAFVGMMVILRPGFGAMPLVAVLPLIAAFMWALYQILTRIVSRTDPPLVSLFYTGLLGLIGTSALIPFYWRTPDANGWILLVGIALFSGAAHYFLNKALELAPAATLQPFSYSVLIWATLVGFLVFDDLPDGFTIVGAVIIVASGLYAFARERQQKQS